jgi:16S rRNA C967 or C1407 C5-methylase (RsmB/RsmF family)/NOL1/NOP2/fmu family ribosome biogenesis protein
MGRLLGNEYSAFLASYKQPVTVGLRVNTLKLSPEAFRTISPFSLSPIPWSPAGFQVTGAGQPGKHPYYAAGLYYLQEPSAMAVAELLDPQPGERVLDISAAPGGKATHLAALTQNEGLLVANEIHPQRAWELAENLERWGTRHAAITNATPLQLADHFGGFFDRVLVDVPCSGEGMFRKSEAARREWSPELVKSCALRQGAILEQARRLVRPGGRMIYSTCTFAPEEDEGAVRRFLEKHSEFELVEAPQMAGFCSGRPEWIEAGQTLPKLRETVRLWPHLASGEGHFIALLQKNDSPELDSLPSQKLIRIPRPVVRLLGDFCRENLASDHPFSGLPEDRLRLKGSYLYLSPDGLPDLTGLKVIHPSWWLGTVKKDRFEPSHALALGLKAGHALRVLDLEPDDARVNAYLRGETLENQGEDGWVLVTVNGFPLGWGKRVLGRVKNNYPRGLRWS